MTKCSGKGIYLTTLGASNAGSRNIAHIFNNFSKGQAVIISVGGAKEMLCLQKKDEIDLIILNRKGFIKEALRHG